MMFARKERPEYFHVPVFDVLFTLQRKAYQLLLASAPAK